MRRVVKRAFRIRAELRIWLALALVMTVVGVVVLFFGVTAAVKGYRFASDAFATPDPAHRCLAGQSGRCFRATAGVIAKASPDTGYEVRYVVGDTTHTDSFRLRREDWKPEPGMKIELERWHGYTVALYDPASHRRGRTTHWPGGWSWAIQAALLFVGALVAILVGLSFVGCVLAGLFNLATGRAEIQPGWTRTQAS